MWPLLKERDKIPSPSGRQESAFSGRKMGLVQRGTLAVFYIRVPGGNRETTAEEVVNARVSGLKPAVNNERRRKGKEQASSSVPTGKGQTDVKSSTSLEASPATRAVGGRM